MDEGWGAPLRIDRVATSLKGSRLSTPDQVSMKTKIARILSLGALLVAALGAHAGPVVSGPGAVTMVLDGQGGASAGISHTITVAGDFTDVYQLNGLSGWAIITSSLMTSGKSTFGIDFFSASINGVDFLLTQTAGSGIADFTERGNFDGTDLGSPFTLVVKGHAGDGLADGTAINATYSGSINMSAVPEPASLALAAIGLCAAGLVTRRRKSR